MFLILEVAIYLVDFHAHLLKTDLLEDQGILLLLNIAYPNLMKFYPRYKTWPRYKDMMPAVTLLQDVQEWVDRVPDSDLYKKALYAGDLLLSLKLNTIFFRNCAESPTTEFEKKYLISFARFFVALYEPEEFLEMARKVHGGGLLDVERALAFLREYLNQNESISL
ncbi:hypothetical protein BDZ94DRAFT_1249607 [Collybia nuda]|uniref:Uncharacterized protein n=1 Tax=Collybia nuda TaxID=64659 RepID=A0A9P5YEB9_9AGAR|nr:hypothetical protein BDZ94DRAFT_1249607 [Collybia nuda]